MEKFKNFVSKFQVLFKLAAIALLVVMVFAPFVSINPFTYSVLFYIENVAYLTEEWKHLATVAYIILALSALTILLLVISFFYKKILSACLYIFLLDFITFGIIAISIITMSLTSSGTYATPAIPHIAFYVAIILLIADIATLVLMKKPISKKDAKIAELEKRIEELENGKDGE